MSNEGKEGGEEPVKPPDQAQEQPGTGMKGDRATGPEKDCQRASSVAASETDPCKDKTTISDVVKYLKEKRAEMARYLQSEGQAGVLGWQRMSEERRKAALEESLGLVARLLEKGGKWGFSQAVTTLEHYMDATGTPLSLPFDEMLSDSDTFQEAYFYLREEALKKAFDAYTETKCVTMTVTSVGSPVSSSEFEKWADPKWYLAIGGGSAGYHARVYFEPTGDVREAIVTIIFTPVFVDRYNWDSGKSADIPGIGRVEDRVLGRLEAAGKAKSFDMIAIGTPLVTRYAVSQLRLRTHWETRRNPCAEARKESRDASPGR